MGFFGLKKKNISLPLTWRPVPEVQIKYVLPLVETCTGSINKICSPPTCRPIPEVRAAREGNGGRQNHRARVRSRQGQGGILTAILTKFKIKGQPHEIDLDLKW